LSSAVTIAQVALPIGLSQTLRYMVPGELRDSLRPGHRVRVPLRGRKAHGIVVALSREDERPAGGATRLREILALDPEEVLLSRPLLDLVRWVADYYAAPLGMAVEAAVPRAVARPPKPRTRREAAGGEGETTRGEGEASAAGPRARSGAGDIEPASVRTHPFVLNAAQAAAVQAIHADLKAASGRTFLLQGVTGSGKTEVYLQAIAAAIAEGRSALFLVPEIALGTQIVRWVRERFGDLVVEYHSQLTAAERRQAWWRAYRGEARILVGARSAVFTPLSRLGLVVVDEEHEPSYKQSETPRYHGRDTALMRARLEGAVTVLGSATPSLESRRNAAEGKYARLHLPERIEARPPARVTLVDLRLRPVAEPAVAPLAPAAEGVALPAENVVPPAADVAPLGPAVAPPTPSPAADGAGPAPGCPAVGPCVVPGAGEERGEPLSGYLRERLRTVVTAGEQAILFLNRRGYSTAVQCRACGQVFECPRCSVVLTYHRTEGLLRCHYCNHEVRDLERCPACGGHDFAYTGIGTQKVEAALARHLPQARVLRMDLDSTRSRGSLAGMIRAFERGEADVLLGTQMVAKGFDFPNVTLVGVIQADREMGLPDFRSQERAFQLLTQVAGRAGRGAKPGEVVFQTYLPDHHVIATAACQDYETFYAAELEERRMFHYAPFRRMANLLFDAPDEAAVIREAERIAARLRGRPGLELLGPAPMPLSRLKNQYRWHLTLLSARASLLTGVLREVLGEAWNARPRGRVRIQGDMDPASML